MHGGRVETLHIVQRNRWIDEKAKQASPDQIPKSHRNKPVNRPFIVLGPGREADHRPVLIGFKADENQRHEFQSAERTAEDQNDGRRPGEVEMVKHPEDATGQIQNRGE